jgi:carbohydrate diacid regulator
VPDTPFRMDERIAREIVRRTMLIVDANVNVMDADGIIIASGEADRVGDLHEGALLALMQKRVVEIDEAVTDRLHGVRPGINLPLRCDERIAGVVGLTGEPESLRERGELVRMAAEMMLEQARLTDMLGRDTRLREELVLSLVRHDAPPAALTDWAQRLGIDLALPRVVAVLEVDSAGLTVDTAIEQFQRLQTLLTAPDRSSLVATVSLSEIVLLKPVRVTPDGWNSTDIRQRMTALLARAQGTTPLGLRIALGHFFEGPGALARSYTTARTALRIGKQRDPGRTTFFYEELALPVLLDGLRSGWWADELRRPLEKLIAQEGSSPLRRTLRAWFAHDMRASETAAALHIHRNTLDYRLARISELTGLDMTRLDNQLRLYLALHLQDAGDDAESTDKNERLPKT